MATAAAGGTVDARARATGGAAGIEGARGGLGWSNRARDRCAGSGGGGCSWSGGAGRGKGGPAHPRPEGMSHTSLRHCWAWRRSNLRGRGEFQKLGR